jgi:hypothetical protein
MQRFLRAALVTAIVVTAALPALAQQQADPNSPRYKGVVALQGLIESEGDQAILDFIETRIAASVRESMSDEQLVETLTAMRAEAAGAEMQGASPIGELAAELNLDPGDGTQLSIAFELDPGDNDRFKEIRTPAYSIG